MKLLEAACEAVGGREALAAHLGISETLLSKLMADLRDLPDALLLKAVDLILSNRDPVAHVKSGADGAGTAPNRAAGIA